MDRETALRELSAGNPDLQRLAARVLGRWADDEVLDALVGALQSPHRGIRDAATDTLIEIGDARTVKRLLPLLKSNLPAVRNSARSLLQRLSKAAPELLVDLAHDPDVRMRIFAANIMAESGDHELAVPLLDLLDDPDENVRDAAVVGLGRLGAPEAVVRLEEIASSGASWTRFSAIDALGEIRAPEALRALLRIVADASPELQEPALEALGRQRATESVLPLIQLLHTAPALGPVVASVLAALPAVEVARRVPGADRPVLAQVLSERLRQNGLAPAAAAAFLDLLGELGEAVDAAVFLRPLASTQRSVQRAAVRAAGRLRLSETIPLLRQLKSQGDPALSGEIQEALSRFGEPGKERS
jgi:HEAT repeat protein